MASCTLPYAPASVGSPPSSRSSDSTALILACLVYVCFALWIALNAPPWGDEGWFASPAYNLVHHGHMGTSVLDPYGYLLRPKLHGLETHTYWVMPLNLIAQVGWYHVFGFGLLQMRLLSIAWGLVAIVSTFTIVRKLTSNPLASALGALLLSFDLLFVHFGALGRMDMMCLGLGLAGQAVYLLLREGRFGLSLLVSHLLVAGSGLTHPNGIVPLAGLLLLLGTLDLGRLRLRHLLLIALPYLLSGVLYGLYILQDPVAFAAQIAGNNVGGGRSYYLVHPVKAIAEEILRYRIYYGLVADANPLSWIKAIALFILVAGSVGYAVRTRLRTVNERLLVLSGLLPVLVLTFFNFKNAYYLISVIPLLTATAASWFATLWQDRGWRRVASVAAVLVLVSTDTVTTITRGVATKMHDVEYQTIAELVRPLLPTNGTKIAAPPQFAFLLGFDRVVQDESLGYFTGRSYEVIIETHYTPEEIAYMRGQQPDLFRHRDRVISDHYTPIFRGALFTAYQRSALPRLSSLEKK